MSRWICPECGHTERKASKLRGHIAYSMQDDESHEWENLPVSHHDMSEAEIADPERELGNFSHGG